jgi:hypothetical protein
MSCLLKGGCLYYFLQCGLEQYLILVTTRKSARALHRKKTKTLTLQLIIRDDTFPAFCHCRRRWSHFLLPMTNMINLWWTRSLKFRILKKKNLVTTQILAQNQFTHWTEFLYVATDFVDLIFKSSINNYTRSPIIMVGGLSFLNRRLLSTCDPQD